MSRAHSSSVGGSTQRRGSSRRSAIARSRQLLRWTFALVSVACAVGLALLVPAQGRPPVVVAELVVSLVLGAAVAVTAERWNRARIVDLRHHDLLEGLRHTVLPGETQVASVDLRRGSRSVPPPSEHRLFGMCDCEHCAAGQPQVADDAVTGASATPRRDAPGRRVIDLRAGAARQGRARLGDRPTPTR